MSDSYSEHSMLKDRLTNEEKMIGTVIHCVERDLRAMCRLMQVYEDRTHQDVNSPKDSLEEIQAVFGAFYRYVDQKMDMMAELSCKLEEDFRWLSLERLRESEEFMREAPRHNRTEGA